jgi:hypothetical protein
MGQCAGAKDARRYRAWRIQGFQIPEEVGCRKDGLLHETAGCFADFKNPLLRTGTILGPPATFGGMEITDQLQSKATPQAVICISQPTHVVYFA